MQIQEQIVKVKSKGGRPSKNKQLEIRKILEDHFEKGESASHTSQVTGINIKTVSIYFNEFTESLVESSDTDFITRMIVAKEFALYRLDIAIDELEKQRLRIEKMIELHPNRPKWLDLRLSLIMKTAKLHLLKFEIEANPRYSRWYYQDNNHKNPLVKFWSRRIRF